MTFGLLFWPECEIYASMLSLSWVSMICHLAALPGNPNVPLKISEA